MSQLIPTATSEEREVIHSWLQGVYLDVLLFTFYSWENWGSGYPLSCNLTRAQILTDHQIYTYFFVGTDFYPKKEKEMCSLRNPEGKGARHERHLRAWSCKLMTMLWEPVQSGSWCSRVLTLARSPNTRSFQRCELLTDDPNPRPSHC